MSKRMWLLSEGSPEAIGEPANHMESGKLRTQSERRAHLAVVDPGSKLRISDSLDRSDGRINHCCSLEFSAALSALWCKHARDRVRVIRKAHKTTLDQCLVVFRYS